MLIRVDKLLWGPLLRGERSRSKMSNEPQGRRIVAVTNNGWLKNNNRPCDLRLLPRCRAKAKSTGSGCGNPAMKGKRVCWIHGGRSKGPRTREGLSRSKSANLRHGHYRKEKLERRKYFNSMVRECRKLILTMK